MFNHRVRNINSVLPIYTASGIYISEAFFVNGNFADLKIVQQSRRVFITGSDAVKFTGRSLFNCQRASRAKTLGWRGGRE